MWWECSECGAQTERVRRPLHCDECGTAGPVFTQIDVEELGPMASDDRRQAWLELGAKWRMHLDQLAA